MKRATKRPAHLDPPAHLSPSPPVPEAEPIETPEAPAGEEGRLDPTRYGRLGEEGHGDRFLNAFRARRS